MDLINVVACPYCGDTWTTDKDKIDTECLCFRCHNKYIPDKIYKMYRFVFNAIKSVKGQ